MTTARSTTTTAPTANRDYNRANWLGETYNSGLPIEHTMYTSGGKHPEIYRR